MLMPKLRDRPPSLPPQVAIAFALGCMIAFWQCASPPPSPKPAAATPAPPAIVPSTPPSTPQLYDVSGLGGQYPDLINVPGLEECKNAGKAFYRGLNWGGITPRCNNVTMESGWCDFSGISAKFAALGNVKITIKDLPGMADLIGKSPSELMQALQTAGWLPDQCGTNEGTGSTREPVVYFYRVKENSGSAQASVLQVLPVCLEPPKGATWKYASKGLCLI